MLKLTFKGDTPELLNAAIKDYVSKLKGGGRGGSKDKGDGEAEGAAVGQTGTVPPPLPPPNGGAQGFNPGGQTGQFNPNPAFAPQAGGVGQAGGAFPAAGAPGVAPEVQAIVQRIGVRLDAAIASGQPADNALQWLKTEIAKAGVGDPSQADMNAAKTFWLPKLPMPALENIAKLMGA